MTTKDDLYYIRRVKQGEVDSFVYLVRRYNRMIFTLVNKIVVRREEAEDITQEVFIKAYQNLEKFREESEFSTWIYSIAYNTAISEFRKRKNNHLAFDDNYDNIADAEISGAIDTIDSETQLKYLEQVLNTMPEDEALIITMFYLNDQTVKQISDITGYSESNVKVKLYRIRKYMNAEMNKLIAQ